MRSMRRPTATVLASAAASAASAAALSPVRTKCSALASSASRTSLSPRLSSASAILGTPGASAPASAEARRGDPPSASASAPASAPARVDVSVSASASSSVTASAVSVTAPGPPSMRPGRWLRRRPGPDRPPRATTAREEGGEDGGRAALGVQARELLGVGGLHGRQLRRVQRPPEFGAAGRVQARHACATLRRC
eukprot:SM000019S05122  [mRNA]  locus=s19:1010239:1010901:+ [translate_table: standard]